MSWYHGTTIEMAQRACALGHMPADYTSQKAVWGPGVYMSDDATEVERWGEEHLRLDISQARMWDVSAETWGWGPLTVADNFPPDLREWYYDQIRDSGILGSNAYGALLRQALEQMGYDGLIFRGDNGNRWAVCYRPQLVQAQHHHPMGDISKSLPRPAYPSFSETPLPRSGL